MSYSTIYKVTPGVGVEELAELRNAWGAAPVVWGVLTERYLHKPRHAWSLCSTELWALWQDERLPMFARAALCMTFDRAYIEREHFRRAAEDIRSFVAWMPVYEGVNHWPEIAALLDKYADDESFPAMGFQHTSVSESLWHGPYDEEKDDYGPLDWTRYWSIYPEFETVGVGAAAQSQEGNK